MRVLVIGGTGRTGRQVAMRAAATGHDVVALGRSAGPESVPPGVTPLPADVLDEQAMDAAVEGMDAVVVALSIPRASRSPFAPVVGPEDLHSRSTRILLDAMARHGVQRLIKVSAQGVGDSAPRAGWGFRALVALSNLAPAFTDHAVADRQVRETDLDWTIVRPPILADGSGGGVQPDPDGVTWSWTRVAIEDVATWIVDALDDESTSREVLSLTPV